MCAHCACLCQCTNDKFKLNEFHELLCGKSKYNSNSTNGMASHQRFLTRALWKCVQNSRHFECAHRQLSHSPKFRSRIAGNAGQIPSTFSPFVPAKRFASIKSLHLGVSSHILFISAAAHTDFGYYIVCFMHRHSW